ncbi:MFS multidrug transporter [Aspergillus flavus]|uniref:MFS multidrug transporter n=1 Tax=Aspergillus flavus TaxID=5059 RepID=A0AB74BYW5_ASPFL|nr:MFS multidrug transporter [Aspergillus flavus]
MSDADKPSTLDEHLKLQAKPEDELSESLAVPEKHEPEWLEGVPLVMAVSGTTLVVFLMLLDISIVSTAIPQITNQFHSLDDVAWYGSAYTIARYMSLFYDSASLQPLTGKFYNYFQLKWTFLSFFAFFEIGSLICGVANSSKMLIIGRAVAGMGSSGMLNGAMNILAAAVPMHKRPTLMGIIMGIAQLGLVSGPLIGGAFTTSSTWRWCFYINLPIGVLVGALLISTRIPEQKPKEKASQVVRSMLLYKFDWIGFVLFAPACIQLLLALQYGGNQYPWDSATVIGLFCGTVATLLVFIAWERHMGRDAMIPGYLLRDRIVVCCCMFSMMVFGMTMILSYYLPIYFQSVRGKSALVSGVNLLPNILCQLVMAVISGVLTGKLGYYLPWGVFGAMLNSIGSGLLSNLTPDTSVPDWAGYQSLVGFGRGAATQVPMVAIQNQVTADEVSTALALMTCSQTLGGAIFLAVGQVIFAQALRVKIPQHAPAVDPETVIGAGATGFRDVVSLQDLPGVLTAYAKSVDRVFYLGVGLSVAQFVFAWGVGLKNVKKDKGKLGGEFLSHPTSSKPILNLDITLNNETIILAAPALRGLPAGLSQLMPVDRNLFPNSLRTSGQHPPIDGKLRHFEEFPREITGPTPQQRVDYPEEWIHKWTEVEFEELLQAVEGFIASGTPLISISKNNFWLPTLESALQDIQDDILNGCGFIMFRGLPISRWGYLCPSGTCCLKISLV